MPRKGQRLKHRLCMAEAGRTQAMRGGPARRSAIAALPECAPGVDGRDGILRGHRPGTPRSHPALHCLVRAPLWHQSCRFSCSSRPLAQWPGQRSSNAESSLHTVTSWGSSSRQFSSHFAFVLVDSCRNPVLSWLSNRDCHGGSNFRLV
jgi:hypothetical protein